MAHFFFDVNDGRKRAIDDRGVELNDLEEARKTAMRELAQIMQDELQDGQRAGYVVTVRDEDRIPVYVATASVIGEYLKGPG